jgi:hypothetical protein
MATTPNFNWSTPDNTGLVKNGALDIRTLGNSIDASLVDLKGGTSGQVLKKNSNTDMDFVWSSDSAGMTNPMTTTGDTIYSSSGSTPARLGIGSTGQVLTVTGGVPSWATPASANPAFVGCSVFANANQTVANNTYTALTWNQETFDTDSFHNNSTNTSRITIPTGKGGYYAVFGFVQNDTNTAGGRTLAIYKNGALFAYVSDTPSAQAPSSQISATMSLVATDYIELFVYQDSGATRTYFKDSALNASFNANLIGA